MAGGQEQQRMVDMARQAAQFGNDAMLGQFGAQNTAQLAGAQFGNDARTQQGLFGLGAQQAGNQAAMQSAQFNNAARSQGLQEMTNIRNQPINELNSLLTSSQVQAPNYTSTPQVDVGNTNVAGLINQNYQQRLAQSQSMNNSLGGLFGLAMNPLGGFFG
ncbi:hypothetical protein JJJ17_13995 [Paracoccus caeni]|uniref:Uncharacterized protein n=1 Tax=Paracoccus caeni TaxID=657651 RepID=A0A934SDT1_9RHOB|nr:hypothetical protein [Paracoccus caeni]MBK4217041.1 hypothetical protein [Paracoccus caeni]